MNTHSIDNRPALFAARPNAQEAIREDLERADTAATAGTDRR
jgi:hypothetical protein